MHAADLAKLAVVVASSAHEWVGRKHAADATGIQRYWTASQCRLERWSAGLHEMALAPPPGEAEPSSSLPTRAAPPLLEEILVSDLLTRAWTAAAIAHDRTHKESGEAESLARRILTGHEEARQRTLHLILEGPSLRPEQAVSLNRLRRRMERWTDVLIGHLMADLPYPAIAQIAYDAEAASQTATRLAPYRHPDQRAETWETVRLSLTDALENFTSAAEPELNQQIAAAILTCLGPELAGSPVLPETFWRLRMENAAHDMHSMLEELLAIELIGEPGLEGLG